MDAPGAAQVGHEEDRVAGDKAGAAVVLVKVVGVRSAAVAVAVCVRQGVEPDQVQVLADLGVHADDGLILLEDGLGVILIHESLTPAIDSASNSGIVSTVFHANTKSVSSVSQQHYWEQAVLLRMWMSPYPVVIRIPTIFR